MSPEENHISNNDGSMRSCFYVNSFFLETNVWGVAVSSAILWHQQVALLSFFLFSIIRLWFKYGVFVAANVTRSVTDLFNCFPVRACLCLLWLSSMKINSLLCLRLCHPDRTADDCRCVHWNSHHALDFLASLQVSIPVRMVRTDPVWFTSASTTKSTSTTKWSWSAWSPLTCWRCWRRNQSLRAAWRSWGLVSAQEINGKVIQVRRASLIMFNLASPAFPAVIGQEANCDCLWSTLPVVRPGLWPECQWASRKIAYHMTDFCC